MQKLNALDSILFNEDNMLPKITKLFLEGS